MDVAACNVNITIEAIQIVLPGCVFVEVTVLHHCACR